MNLKQAEIVLEKITRLYKSMKLDERNIDVFEQDLMLSYIRQLHESFSPGKPISRRKDTALPPKEEVSKPIVKEIPKAAPVSKPSPPKVEPPVVVEKPTVAPPPVVETPKVVVPPKPVVVPEPPKPAPPPPPKPVIQTPPPQPVKALTGLSAVDRAALFEFKEATELSEKLSMQPIRDLTKAMGLNEKIFTINELFGGDSKAFDETVKKLNTFSSFERASEYLANGVAHTYNWPSRSKKKKALNFIQLVKRRYHV